MIDYDLIIPLARQRVCDLAAAVCQQQDDFSKKQLLIAIFDTFRGNAVKKDLFLFVDEEEEKHTRKVLVAERDIEHLIRCWNLTVSTDASQKN
jgi:hypothetical protein